MIVHFTDDCSVSLLLYTEQTLLLLTVQRVELV